MKRISFVQNDCRSKLFSKKVLKHLANTKDIANFVA